MRLRVLPWLGLLAVAACGGNRSGSVDAAAEDAAPAPIAADDSAATTEGVAVSIAVLANDADPAGAALSVVDVTAPAHGTAVRQPDGTVAYTPAPAFTGTDSFRYTIAAADRTASASVTVTVVGPVVLLPKSSIAPDEVGVIVNDADPQSTAVAAYYLAARGIPAENLIHVQLPLHKDALTAEEFAPVKAAVDAATPDRVQAYALTWLQPFRVEGMSVTSAFALGCDPKYWHGSASPCAPTAAVDYFGSESVSPYLDHGLRPAMALAGVSVENVMALIDRGVAADDTFPGGTGYFVRTSDVIRSVRWPDQEQTVAEWDHPDGLVLVFIDNSTGTGANSITGETDVLFYFTGLVDVPGIATNTYRPGALADHVTSFGGVLTTGNGQMSILRWLEAGATASFGTVVEPCNYPQKNSLASKLLRFYFRGQTAIEAYWKSVEWPGEGLFVGEPLARPWGRATVIFADGALTIRLTWLDPQQTYELGAAEGADGPFTPVLSNVRVPQHQMAEITLPNADRPYYKLAPTGGL
jgi:uncharacterized protein (TIGR03790 family)